MSKVYVLVHRSYDYYEFDEVVAASASKEKVVAYFDALDDWIKNLYPLCYYNEEDRENEPLYEKLSGTETPHCVIVEFDDD